MSESTFEEEHVLAIESTAPSTLGADEAGKEGTSSSDEKIVANADNAAVRCSKVIVLIFIGLAAVAFGTVTYFFTSNEEEGDFELQYVDLLLICFSNPIFKLLNVLFHFLLSRFKDFAEEISAVVHIEAENVFGLVESMALTMTSYSIDTNVSWPFITMPHFEKRGTKNNELSRALHLSLVTLLPTNLSERWENYSLANQGWVQEGVEASPALHEEFLGPNLQAPQIPSHVFRFEEEIGGPTVPQEEAEVDGQYGVVWQQAPAPHAPSIVNYDLLSHPVFARIYSGMWETSSPVLSEVTEISFLYEGAIRDEITHPHSFLLHPIYSSLQNENTHREDMVGFLVAVLPWDAYFQDLLSSKTKGVVVVLHNTCGEHFTYRLDGPEAIYVGKLFVSLCFSVELLTHFLLLLR